MERFTTPIVSQVDLLLLDVVLPLGLGPILLTSCQLEAIE